jgi:anti-anti-sigma factor
MSDLSKCSPDKCPACGETVAIEPLQSPGEALCAKCGFVLWYRKRTVDDVTMIDAITGKVALSQEIDKISRVLIREGTVPQVVINLAGVQLVTSSFIAGLVALHKRACTAGGKMVVCQMSPVVRETLQGAKLDKLLNLADSEQEALACF